MMFCQKCGKEIDENTRFCPYCGANQHESTAKKTIISDEPTVSLKERLQTSLGAIGVVIWYVFSLLIVVAPLVVLDLPWWIEILIILLYFRFYVLGGIAELILYIWGLTTVIGDVQDGFAIAYYVLFAIYCLTSLIPTLISIISTIFDK